MARLLPSGLLIQHIPRTGGTTIERSLELLGMPFDRCLSWQPKRFPKKHSLLNYYFRTKLLQVKRIACFVRHPIEYYESTWKYFCKKPADVARHYTNWDWHPQATAAKWFDHCGGASFNDWAFLMTINEPAWYTRMVEQYVGPPGGEWVQFVGRTESLVVDFNRMLKWSGDDRWGLLPEDAPRHNVITVAEPLEWEDSVRDRVLISEQLMLRRFYENAVRELDSAKALCWDRIPDKKLAQETTC